MLAKLFMLFPVLLLTGCYTMIYPPPEYYAYEEATPDSLAETSVVNGVNINIYNNIDDVYLNRYYQDSRYFRQYRWYDEYYWDPYYYNYGSYYHRRYWDHGHYRSGYGSWSDKSRQPQKKRRTENYRRESDQPDVPVDFPPSIFKPSDNPANAVALPPPPTPKEVKEEPKQRSVRSIEEESKEKEAQKENEDGKKSRRKESPRK